MKRTTALLGAAVAAGGLTLAAPALPASAAVTTSVVGTSVTVTVTGSETVSFGCTSGQLRVNGSVTSPAVLCSALGTVTVNGDNGDQVIRGDQLVPSTFPALASNHFNTGGGSDTIETSRVWDSVNAGAGDDAVVVHIDGLADPQVVLGGSANDSLYLVGTTGNDEIVGSSTGANGSFSTKVGSAATVGRDYSGAGQIIITGDAGDDLLDTSKLFTPSVSEVDLDAGPGNDTMRSASMLTYMDGGLGTNTFDGGAAADYITTRSATDVINPGSGLNRITDTTSLSSGGRTVNSLAGSDGYETWLTGADAVWRLRPGAAGSNKSTASLHRPGIQLLPSATDIVGVKFSDTTDPADHALADIVASTDTTVTVSDSNKMSALIDITIPTGSWTTAGTIGNGTGTVDPSEPTLGNIKLFNVGPVSVHGPWANKDRGWAHRATRDLDFRFASGAQLDAVQSQLASGTTRAVATAALMDTDEYRGLDVDRVFVKYLGRAADPSGRAYWINAIEGGRPLWRFRAQLFGSNEYFTKAGATNAAWVTKAYNDVLGRNPDPGGQAYWTKKLDAGAERGTVALQFINSAETRRRVVDDQYLRFFDRVPTTSEQNAGVTQLLSATGEQQLIATLVASAEYYDRT